MSSTIKLGDGMVCIGAIVVNEKKYQQPPRNDSLFVKQAINNITMNSKNVLNSTQGTQDCDYVFFDVDPL